MAFEELAKHEKNWSSDWNTLQAAARDDFPGPTILARVLQKRLSTGKTGNMAPWLLSASTAMLCFAWRTVGGPNSPLKTAMQCRFLFCFGLRLPYLQFRHPSMLPSCLFFRFRLAEMLPKRALPHLFFLGSPPPLGIGNGSFLAYCSTQ